MKTFSIMEMALRIFYKRDEKTSLKKLVRKAVEDGVVQDAGFRHVPNDPENEYSKKFVNTYPDIRNNMAHGTDMLVGTSIDKLMTCADFINQLFPSQEKEA